MQVNKKVYFKSLQNKEKRKIEFNIFNGRNFIVLVSNYREYKMGNLSNLEPDGINKKFQFIAMMMPPVKGELPRVKAKLDILRY